MQIDNEFDLLTGHLKTCKWSEVYNNPECIYKEHTKCGRSMSKQSCFKEENGRIIGFCTNTRNGHWEKYCDSKKPFKWTMHMSACANEKCDRLKMSYEERSTINHKNIKSKLGLPEDIKYNHISKSVRRRTNKEVNERAEQMDFKSTVKENSSNDNTTKKLKKLRTVPSDSEFDWTDDNGHLIGLVESDHESVVEGCEEEYEEEIELNSHKRKLKHKKILRVEDSEESSESETEQETELVNNQRKDEIKSVPKKEELDFVDNSMEHTSYENKPVDPLNVKKDKFCGNCSEVRKNMENKFCTQCRNKYDC